MPIKGNSLVAIGSRYFKDCHTITEPISFNIPPQNRRIHGVRFDGKNSCSPLGREQRIEAKVSAKIDHCGPWPNRGTKYVPFLSFIEVREMPQAQAGIRPNVDFDDEIIVKIIDADTETL